MKVVGDQRELESALLGGPGMANQVVRTVFLAGERVADLGQWLAFPPLRPAAFF
jgi:hypothetical protein